jgi:outer membrane protein OmpA-like peptidoglycan-associated protein
LTLGLKLGLWSEDRGAPFSFSVRNDFIIPTVTNLSDLLANGTQTGAFDDLVSFALSKNWSNAITVTGNAGFEFTTDPTSGGVVLFHQADQIHAGAGFILFPQSRFEIISEYNAVVFTGHHTPDMTFGARDPVDGVWGVRFYLNRAIAVDAGYRYMLNLANANDRSGFIVQFGTTHWREKPVVVVNRPPVVSCSADKAAVTAGSNDVVNISATANSPNGNPLTYGWTATGGNVNGSGPQVRWAVSALMPGNYTATVRVDDGQGGNATCSVNARVDPRPNRPPTVSLAADRNSVLVGERVHFTATASDPDGDPLTYTWRTNGGQLSGNGTTDDLDTTGVAPGTYTVTVRVDDGRGGAADASASIQANAPPPPPVSSRLNGCDFKLTNSSRVDNVCKRVLDDVALRLQNDPRAKVVIVGFADPRERTPDQLAGTRGSNAASYLGDKGVDRSRITTRTGTGQAGAGQTNRRIDIIWVPEGATY